MRMSEKSCAGPVRIGTVEIPNRVFFAPMAGVSDLPFRLLCHEQGAGLVCMEMISAKAITFRSRRTGELWETTPEEKPVSLQIFGHEPDVMGEACRILEEQTFDILDINMGCPVPKIVGNQEGSALMRDPGLIEKVVRACVENTSRPVTVKMRRGFDADHINAVECALAAEAGGASAVAVHGRTREQMYSGTADWSTIADVKKALAIPVIGNGDVVDGPSAKRMMDETGCDAVMIARAAQGNPWIFKEVNAYLERGAILERPPRRDIVRMILRHADMLCECKGEKVGMREMRGHVHNYLSGFPGASRVRGKVNSITTKAELQALLAKEYPYA
jgi:nifR3 family TIM-barrel protein